jgi:hypothetical protein
MNKYFLYLLTVLPILLSPKAKGQIRTQGANYLEVSAGVPILWDNNVFNLKAGEKSIGLSYAMGTSRGNYHRLNFAYRKEFVKSIPISSNYENFVFKYSYENTLLKGRNHLSYLGLLYGLGFGVENLNNSYNTNLQNSTVYPLATIGLNFEKFIGSSFGVFIRIDTDATTSAISQKIKANADIGLKIKL